jgi:hypothetical protein
MLNSWHMPESCVCELEQLGGNKYIYTVFTQMQDKVFSLKFGT